MVLAALGMGVLVCSRGHVGRAGVLDELGASSICPTGSLRGKKGKESWSRRAFGLILTQSRRSRGLGEIA